MKNYHSETVIHPANPMQDDQKLSNTLYVHTFGTLTLEYAGKKIDCVNQRSNLIWSILAYLISNQGRAISTENLIEHVRGALTTSVPPMP